jgi:hypothetical protein
LEHAKLNSDLKSTLKSLCLVQEAKWDTRQAAQTVTKLMAAAEKTVSFTETNQVGGDKNNQKKSKSLLLCRFRRAPPPTTDRPESLAPKGPRKGHGSGPFDPVNESMSPDQ